MYYFKDFNDVDWNTLKYIYKIKISTRLEKSWLLKLMSIPEILYFS